MAPYNRYMSEIDTDFFRTICLQHGEMRSYRKGEYLLHGEVFPYVGLVESGVFKYSCPGAEGKTHTIGFAFEGEFVGDYPNCLYQRKPEVQIQALTPCQVILCPAEKLMRHFELSLENQTHARIAAEQLFMQIYSRYMDLYRFTPEERYQQLLRQHREMVQQIPLKEIASFLRITPIHMSRIRKKLLQE